MWTVASRFSEPSTAARMFAGLLSRTPGPPPACETCRTRGHHHLVAAVLDGPADKFLVGVGNIDLGGVEVGDADVLCPVDSANTTRNLKPETRATPLRPSNLVRRITTGNRCSIAALLCCIHASALEPKPVGSIEILGGAATSPLQTQEGQPLDSAKLRNDVKAFWRSGRFSDVQVETVENDESVKVVFRLQLKRTLRLRRIEVKPPTAGIDLQFTPNSQIDAQGAQQIGESVRKQLASSGHPFVNVEAVLIPASTGYADLEVRIDQGRRIDIEKVTLAGNLGAPGHSARKALKWTSSKTMNPRIPGIWKGWHILPGYSDQALQYDAANLRSFYYTRGYFDADIRPSAADLTGSRTSVQFDIQSGPRYAIHRPIHFAQRRRRALDHSQDGRNARWRHLQRPARERRKASRRAIFISPPRLEVRDLSDQPPASGADAQRWANLHATTERGRRTAWAASNSAETTASAIRPSGADCSSIELRLPARSDDSAQEPGAKSTGTGLFEPLSQANVTVNTPPGANRADLPSSSASGRCVTGSSLDQ